MKRTKRFLSIILSLILLLTMAMPIMAAEDQSEGTYTVTITDTYDGHVYEAYQIFAGTFTDSTGVLSNIKWGTNFNKTKTLEFLNELKSESAFDNAFASITYDEATEDADDIAVEIAEAIENKKLSHDSEFMKAFAKILHTYTVGNNGDREYTYLNGESKDSTSDNGVSENGVTKYTYKIEELESGYYLIKDRDNSIELDDYDYYTRLMLYVVDDIDINPKGDVPKVSKAVHTTVDGNYNEAVSVAMSDTVYFRLAGTLPSNLKDFISYKYEFVDTLSEGLDLYYSNDPIEAIAESYILHEGVEGKETAIDLSSLIDNKQANLIYDDEDRMLTITFNDLKGIFPNLLSTDRIIIKYKAKLNENAIHGTGKQKETPIITNNEVLIGDSGNENTVYLVYSNDPQGDGTGKTPDDDARVYTFQLEVNKVDETGNDLANAKFILYHRAYESTSQGEIEEQAAEFDYYYAVFEEKNGEYYVDSWVVMDEQIESKDDQGYALDASGQRIKDKINGLEVPIEKMIMVSPEEGAITIKGLSASKFFIHEIEAPESYNKLEHDVEVTITANMDANKTKLENISVIFGSSNSVGNLEEGIGAGTIVNYLGNVLPSTGGTGRTLLYAGGAIFATVAVVFLVTKKRMKSEK